VPHPPDLSLLAQIDFGPIVINFGGLIQGFIAQLFNAVNFLFNFTINVANFLWGTIGNVHGFNLNIFGSVSSFFRNLWEHWIKRGLLKVLELYARLKEKLTKWMEPVLRVLRRMRQLQDLWFNKYLRPVLDLMQRARKILAVFRALHIKWAEALDRRLAQTESRIFEAFNAIRRKTNELITWANLIADPAGLIYGSALGRSIAAVFNSFADALGRAGLFRYAGTPGRSPTAGSAVVSHALLVAEFTDSVERGEGFLAEIGADAVDFYNSLEAA
jgi:hypothetical protein